MWIGSPPKGAQHSSPLATPATTMCFRCVHMAVANGRRLTPLLFAYSHAVAAGCMPRYIVARQAISCSRLFQRRTMSRSAPPAERQVLLDYAAALLNACGWHVRVRALMRICVYAYMCICARVCVRVRVCVHAPVPRVRPRPCQALGEKGCLCPHATMRAHTLLHTARYTCTHPHLTRTPPTSHRTPILLLAHPTHACPAGCVCARVCVCAQVISVFAYDGERRLCSNDRLQLGRCTVSIPFCRIRFAHAVCPMPRGIEPKLPCKATTAPVNMVFKKLLLVGGAFCLAGGDKLHQQATTYRVEMDESLEAETQVTIEHGACPAGVQHGTSPQALARQ